MENPSSTAQTTSPSTQDPNSEKAASPSTIPPIEDEEEKKKRLQQEAEEKRKQDREQRHKQLVDQSDTLFTNLALYLKGELLGKKKR